MKNLKEKISRYFELLESPFWLTSDDICEMEKLKIEIKELIK